MRNDILIFWPCDTCGHLTDAAKAALPVPATCCACTWRSNATLSIVTFQPMFYERIYSLPRIFEMLGLMYRRGFNIRTVIVKNCTARVCHWRQGNDRQATTLPHTMTANIQPINQQEAEPASERRNSDSSRSGLAQPSPLLGAGSPSTAAGTQTNKSDEAEQDDTAGSMRDEADQDATSEQGDIATRGASKSSREPSSELRKLFGSRWLNLCYYLAVQFPLYTDGLAFADYLSWGGWNIDHREPLNILFTRFRYGKMRFQLGQCFTIRFPP